MGFFFAIINYPQKNSLFLHRIEGFLESLGNINK